MNILIVKLTSLGDVIHALPVVADIRRALPSAQIDWVVDPGFAPLVQCVSGIGRVIPCAQRQWRRQWWTSASREKKAAFVRDLQQTAYDAVIDLQGLTKSALVARLAKLTPQGRRYAMANRTEGSSYEAPTRWVAHRAIRLEPHIHVVERSRRLVAQALGYGLTQPADYGLGHFHPWGAGRVPTLLCVHGTSREDKLWPEAAWIEFGRRVIAQGWRLAMVHGNSEEEQRSLRLAQALGEAHCSGWPRMSLDALMQRMQDDVQSVVGVDSGLSHLAVALDLPHVQIYNFPTSWRTGPVGVSHQVAVGGDHLPGVDEVWNAWQQVMGAAQSGACA